MDTATSSPISANVAEVSPALPKSDWSFALMLDEIWLKWHRSIVHHLEKSGLWLTTAPHNTLLQEQKTLGEHLKCDLLSKILPLTDYAYLNSEVVFGASNLQFRKKLPLALAFGYELGVGFYTITDCDPKAEIEVAQLCAVFNLGISIFDLVYDHYPDLFEQFSQVFNEDVLKRLQSDPQAFQAFESEITTVTAVELRILLRLIAWFFVTLQHMNHSGDKHKTWKKKKLSRLLLKAYRSELQSATTDATDVDLLQVSQAKSTLPFAVIYQIAQLAHQGRDHTIQNATELIMTRIATNYWLLDDLVDVVADLQAGALNSILVQIETALCHKQESLGNYAILSELLTGNYIEETVGEICTSLAVVTKTLQAECFHRHAAERMRNVVLAYTRNWIE